MPTYGERLVANLLKSLPKDKFYSIAEPHIPTTKSARQNPDFVIVGAELGVIVLEVKDWKKLKQVNQKEIVVETNNGELRKEENPVLTAKEYAHNLANRFEEFKELFKKYRGKTTLKFPWTYAVAMPHIEDDLLRRCEAKGIWDVGRVLGKDDLTLENIEKALNKLPQIWHLVDPLDMNTLDIIRGVVDPSIIISDQEGKVQGMVTIDQARLVHEPLKPQNRPNQATLPLEILANDTMKIAESASVRLVRGVAGSGKSLVLARRAQHLAEQYPDLKILVLAFNVDLVSDLQRRIPGSPNLEIINFHKMCSRILGKKWRSPIEPTGWLENQFQNLLRQHDMSVEFVAEEIEYRKELGLMDNTTYLDFNRVGRGGALQRDKREVINTIFDQYIRHHDAQRIVDWADIPFLALAEIANDHPLQHHYDVILIDEAQDFAPSWIRIVNELLKSGGTLFICDDPTQSLFRGFSWKQKGVDVVGRTRILSVPFRCTREISQAAYSLIAGDAKPEEAVEPDLTTYQLLSGEKPILVNCRDLSDEIDFIRHQASLISQSGIPASQIAILCHSKRIIKHWAYLRDQGFYVASFNQMKGLEFRAVLLPHLHTVFQQSNPESDETSANAIRRRVFTAMTRARENLILSYHNVFPSELAPLEAYVQRQNGTSYSKRL